MSMFDKLKAYSRKPAAVILATVMATSTIPTTPIAQAVTAAYAESATQGQTEGTEKSAFDATTLVDKNKSWTDLSLPLDLTFSTHITNGKATAHISNEAIVAYVNSVLQDSKYDDTFKYVKGDQSSPVAAAVDAKLASIEKDLAAKADAENKKNDKQTVQYQNVAVKEGTKISRQVKTCAVEASGPEGLTIEADGKGGFNLTADQAVKSGALSLKITDISVDLSFAYQYDSIAQSTTEVEVPPVAESKDESKADSKDDAASPADEKVDKEAIADPVVDYKVKYGDKDAIATVTAGKDKPGLVAGSTLAASTVSAADYYDGLSIPESVTVQDATTLTYKTKHDDYTLFDLSKQGLKADKVVYPKDNENEEFFTAKVTSDDSASVKTVNVYANQAFDSAKMFKIQWVYPDGNSAGTSTVTIPAAAKMKIEKDKISIASQDFRIQSKQEENVKNLANAALNGEIAKFNKEDGDKVKDKKYFTKASFETYDTQGGEQDLKVFYETENSGVYKNYEIGNPDSVHVNAIKTVDWTNDNVRLDSIHNEGNDKITLTAEKDEKNAGHSDWVKERPVATWENHSLTDAGGAVPETADGFKGWTAPETNGEQKQTILALDNESGVVVRVPVAYKLDTTAVEASSIKYGGARQKRHDNIVFSDKSFSVDYQLSPVPSGINSTDVSYHDNKSNSDVNGLKPSTNGGFLYSFEVSGDRELDTDKIKIHAVSNSGMALDTTASQIKGKDQISKDVAKLIAESSGPKVAISYSDTNPQRTANGKDYYNHGRTIRITVTDPFFKYTREYAPQTICEVTRDGSNFATVSTGDNWHQGGSSDEWYVDIPVTADGDYVVGTANVYDVIGGEGHTSSASGEEFVIDQTAPKLNVSWNTEAAQNGKYYNAARTATITVEEHNFDPNLFKIEAPVSAGNGDEATPAQIGGWSSNGDTHTATVTFPGQGVYTLSVSGEDLASNKSESYTSPEFVIDTIKPKIDIQNVVNRTAYAGEVAPTAAVHDTNLADGTSIEVSKISYPLSKDDPNPYAGAAINTSATDKSVSYLNPAKTKGNDGVYTLTVQAIDLAGNTESEAVTWSVNRFGSTYVISDNTGKMLDQYLKSSKTTDVKVTEINPSGLDDNKTSVELTRDTKNTTLKSGDNYTTDANTASGWSEYNYTVSKSNYDKDGAYRVLFHSEDAAGNSSENTMEGKNAKKSGAAAEINFAVDDTAPIASFVDLASNGKYEESSHKAKVSFEDNLKLSKAQIKVNGKTVATFTADQLEKSPIREFTLDGSSSKQDVSVVAWDAAGNKSKELKATGVLVTNDSFVLWMNNLPLMVGTIVAIVVVAGGIYLVVAKKRKENEEK
ncbi:MAG: hypothetical protein ACLTEP_05340 [Collinsella sp.]